MPSQTSSAQLAQDHRVVVGDWLRSSSSNYVVESFLGQGTFGTVVKCTRKSDMKTVAIKMMKNPGSFNEQARLEVAAQSKLRTLDLDKCNLVRCYEVFTCRGHICLEFEHLDKSLYDFLKERYFQPLRQDEIRPIVQQLANALGHLKTIGLIHADLKLENIMLVDHARDPFRVKVIDFGSAHGVSTAPQGSYLQTRPYRSPEILLGLPFTEAVDMWSLGCIAATLYLGHLLFPGDSEYNVMRYIVETQGQPPDSLLNLGLKTGCFFQRDHDKSATSLWKLKTPEQLERETGVWPMETRRRKLTSLHDLVHVRVINHENTADEFAEFSDVGMFVGLLKEMLALDDGKRVTPGQVLEHQFITMQHMVSRYQRSSYVKSCFRIMDNFQIKTPSDSGKAGCGSLQQSSTGTADLVQQNLPPSSAKRSSLSQPRSIMRGMKRKTDDEDAGHHHEGKKLLRSPAGPSTSSNQTRRYTYLERRDHRGKRVRQSPAGSPTCSHSGPIYTPYVSLDPERVPSEHQRHSAQPSSCTKSESRGQSGRKRKPAYDDNYQENSEHERKRVRQSPAGPLTCSRHDSTNTHYVGPDPKRVSLEHHRHSTQPSSCTQTKSRAQSGRKRKPAYDDNYQESSNPEKKRVRQSPAGSPTCSRRDPIYTPYVGPDPERVPFEHHPHSAQPSSCTQTESPTQSGLNRKAAHDEDYQESSDPEKKRVGQSPAGPFTCSRRESTNTLNVGPDPKRVPFERQPHNAQSSSCTQTESPAQSGLKRKVAHDEDVPHRKSTSDLRSGTERSGVKVSRHEVGTAPLSNQQENVCCSQADTSTSGSSDDSTHPLHVGSDRRSVHLRTLLRLQILMSARGRRGNTEGT